jgi:hypothetical protein
MLNAVFCDIETPLIQLSLTRGAVYVSIEFHDWNVESSGDSETSILVGAKAYTHAVIDERVGYDAV